MKTFFQGFFYFSRGERRGIALLLAGIVLVLLGGSLYRHYRRQAQTEAANRQAQTEAVEAANRFLATLETAETFTYNQEKEGEAPYREPRNRLTPFPFDPNRADSATLCRLGLPEWLARNIVRYRERGGRFRRPEEFQKVYGLWEEQYTALLPYIRIAPEDTVRITPKSLLIRDIDRDSLPRYPEKYAPGTTVELNSADTTELKKIPGIGSFIARSIVNHRQQLGGYYRIEQLKEIHLDAEQLRPWLTICTDSIHRLPVNRLSVERLRRHPYLNFYQAKAIVEYRRAHGALKNLKPLALLEEFTKEDLERIAPYLRFD